VAVSDYIGKRLVSVLISGDDISLLPKHSLDETDVLGDARTSLTWVIEYFREHGSWPDRDMVAESTGVDLPIEDKPADYVANLVRERSLAKRLEQTATAIAKQIEARNPDEALKLMGDASLALRSRAKVETPTSFRESGPDRIKAYDDLKEAGGLIGLPTPWERLNVNIGGWCDGTLNVITAMQNTGKSWFCCYCADHALDLGKKVLMVTLEMDIPRIGKRIEAIRYKVPYGRLRGGDMEPETEDEWRRRILKDREGVGDIILADKKMVQRVSDVLFMVMDYKPDIVFIDGGYRFSSRGGGGAGEWANTVEIVNDLQIAAEVTQVPWVVTTQQGDANETGKRKKGDSKMHAWGVRYGKEWVINPDNVIGLYADEDLRLTKSLEIHQLKTRDATGDAMHSEFTISWDLNRMDFSELGALETGSIPVEDDLFGSGEVMLEDA